MNEGMNEWYLSKQLFSQTEVFWLADIRNILSIVLPNVPELCLMYLIGKGKALVEDISQTDSWESLRWANPNRQETQLQEDLSNGDI